MMIPSITLRRPSLLLSMAVLAMWLIWQKGCVPDNVVRPTAAVIETWGQILDAHEGQLHGVTTH